MDESPGSGGHLAATLREMARRLLTIGENRLELLALEVQEERERLLHALLLALGAAVLGLLAGIALTAALVLLLPAYPPANILLALTGLFGSAGGYIWWRLIRLLRDWETLAATLGQLSKDRACLEKILT